MQIAIIVLVALIGAVVGEVSDAEWAQYKEKFNKSYPDAAEDARHRAVYAETKVQVEEHNKKFDAGEVSWSLGINQFADMTSEEIRKTAFGLVPPVGFGSRQRRANLRDS